MKPAPAAIAAVLALAAAASWAPALAKERTCIDPKTRVATDMCPPEATLTPASAAEAEESSRLARLAAETRSSEERARRQLLEKYPSEATLRSLELAELNEASTRIRRALNRLAELLAERKRLDVEMEFYKGKPLPPTQQRAVDTSDALFKAQADVFRDRQGEVADIVAKYDKLYAQLRGAWPRR